jgi:UDP-N-acetylmuramoyl-tripeptide--D-alanyl-D-alanine ligase
MRAWPPEQVAAAAGARLAAAPAPAGSGAGSGGAGGAGAGPDGPGPLRAVIDSRAVQPGDLFVGLPGEHVDGGRFAAQALAAGAWGVLVAPGHAQDARCAAPGVLLAAEDPLRALQDLATSWRRALGAQVVGVTGSTGKTSTKDVLAAMCATARTTVATAQNLNTEIGLPLTVLGAPAGTEVLVLEMAMRGAGQIAELARIAEPDVGLVTNVGPVHLEQLGSLDAIAAEKMALVAALPAGGTAVVPAGDPRVAAHLRPDLQTVTFGPGGDVTDADLAGLDLELTSAHMRLNAQAALAAARALGIEPAGRIPVALSAMRGQRRTLPGGIVVVEDCYNANPMSMRAALDDLAASAPGRKVAVLGDMLELGPDERAFHRQVGEHARAAGIDVLVGVGPRSAHMAPDAAAPDAAAAAALVPGLLQPGDTVLVKASRGVGLEAVVQALQPVPGR